MCPDAYTYIYAFSDDDVGFMAGYFLRDHCSGPRRPDSFLLGFTGAARIIGTRAGDERNLPPVGFSTCFFFRRLFLTLSFSIQVLLYLENFHTVLYSRTFSNITYIQRKNLKTPTDQEQ